MIINLSDTLLHESRLVESRSSIIDMKDGASVAFPAGENGFLHLVLAGTVYCRTLRSDSVLVLGPGDCVLFFYRDAHRFGVDEQAALVGQSLPSGPRDNEDPPLITLGEGYPRATVLSSMVRTAYLPQTAFSVRAAPDYWVLRRQPDAGTFHPLTLDLDQVRVQCTGAGSGAFASALTSLLLIQIVRNVCAEVWDDRDIEMFAPIERAVSAAIREIHANLGRDWTVGRLASQVGISRSAFAKAFHEVTGDTPMAYITAMRMRRAADLLSRRGLPLREVAERVGYPVETSFARAFKKHFGAAPRGYAAGALLDAADGGTVRGGGATTRQPPRLTIRPARVRAS